MSKKTIAILMVSILVLSGCGTQSDGPESSLPDISQAEVSTSTTTEAVILNPTQTDATSTQTTTSSQQILNTTTSKTKRTQKTTIPSHTVSYKELKSGAIDTPQEKKFLSLKGKTVTIATESPYETFRNDVKDFYANIEEKYGITFDWLTLSGSEQQTKIAQLVAAGDAPDVCHTSYVLILRYIYGNVIQSMDPYMDKKDAIWNYRKWTLSMYDWGGSLYALPYTNSPCAYMVYYNKTLFEENNVKTPLEYYKEGKWNFETFLQCAKEMTLFRADGVTVKTYGVSMPVQMVPLMANGESGIGVDKSGDIQITINSKAGMDGLQLLSDLYKGGYCGDGNFAQRKVAMTIDRHPYLVTNNNLYDTMEDEFDMVPFPKGNTDTYYCPMGTDGYAIPRNCKQPLGGMMFLYETYMQHEYGDYNGFFSAEHQKRYIDYISKTTPIYTNLESLAGWWEAGYKGEFWKSIQNGKSPATAIDSMMSVLKAAVRRTAG